MSIDLASKGEGRTVYVVIGLLVLHLTLISIQVEDPSGTSLFKRWVLQAGSPILNGSSRVSSALGNFWRGYIWLHGARGENAHLRSDVRQLVLLNADLMQAKQENERLHKLLSFGETLPYKTLGAHVIGRAPSFLSNTLYLDRGSEDGIQPNQPVVADTGVIGRTVLVARKTCQVQLISNADASVGVIIERTRVPGVVRGSENPQLDLKYVSNTDDVEIGDVAVSSGLDGIYPKGLPVGKIVYSQKGKTGFRDLRVAPDADLVRIEEVLILSGTPKMIALPSSPGIAK